MRQPVRKSLRLKQFDYSSNETYFVTVCLRNREPLFGHVSENALLTQSEIGNMIAVTWISISDRYDSVELDDFIVMPDHVHGLVTLGVTDDVADFPTLGEVIGWFKGKSTYLYGQGVRKRGWPRYTGGFWQSSFHDHIIRNDRDFEARVLYIERNPWRWVENRQ